MNDLDSMIDASHRQAEETEQTARQLEARICRIPGADRLLPVRRYGTPVSPEAIKRNLSLTALINRTDPALAAYLGVQDGSHRRRDEDQAARQLQAQSLAMQTEKLRARNQQAQQQRERAAMAGISTATGRRLGGSACDAE